jgi:Flp pilus assembly pilin Flp
MSRFLFARRDSARAALHKFLTREHGVSIVEYALLLALLSLVCVVAIRTLGMSLSGCFTYASSRVTTAAGS